MGLASKELNSDSGNGFVPKPIAEFLEEVSVIEDGKKLAKINGYVFELEQEMKKIHVFRRELPVCMLLLRDAIDRLKEEAAKMEEFLPSGGNSDEGAKESGDPNDKKNWMSSAQLWTTPVEYDNNFDHVKIQDSFGLYQASRNQEFDHGTGKTTQLESWNVKNWGGAFVPFKKRYGGAAIPEDDVAGGGLSLSPPVARVRYGDGSSFSDTLQASLREQLQQQQHQQEQKPPKKQRRSWSPDLHRRFVNALQQLGGPREATPKQIREVMQVADLTNDEVKSHLQKYRLHVRRMANTSAGESLDLNLDGLGREGGSSQKFNMTQSGSPEGPLHLGGSSKGASASLTLGESLEDEEDAKSEGHSWKGRARSG